MARDLFEEAGIAPVAESTGPRDLLAEMGAAPATKPDAATTWDKIKMGLGDPIQGGAQLLTKMLPDRIVNAGNDANNWLADKTGLVGKLPPGGVDQQTREREAAYQGNRAAGGEKGFDGYRLLGNVVNPVTAALMYAAPTSAASTLLPRMGIGAAAGAAGASLNPVTGEDSGSYWADKMKQAAIGGALGGAVPLGMAAFNRVVTSPNASTNPAVQDMLANNVKPSIGQTLGGVANTIEEKLQSVPLVGDLIRASRTAGFNSFNQAAINKATEPIGQNVSGIGTQGVRDAGDAISTAYQQGKAALGHFQIDKQGASELSNLWGMASNLPAKEAGVFQDLAGYLRGEISPNGSITAEGFKRIDSKLGDAASKFAGSTDAYQKQLGTAIQEMQRVVTENAKRANPAAADLLNRADAAYANLVRVEGASTAAKLTDGVFTPGQLMTAVRGADRSVRDRATARGEALMQDFAGNAQKVLGNKVPDSGTAGRLLALDLPVFGLPAIPAAATYNPASQAFLRNLVARRPAFAQPVAGLLNQTSPMLAPAGGLLGSQVLE